MNKASAPLHPPWSLSSEGLKPLRLDAGEESNVSCRPRFPVWENNVEFSFEASAIGKAMPIAVSLSTSSFLLNLIDDERFSALVLLRLAAAYAEIR
ncbi:hypothetical protein [Bradyrhizobium sp. ARR65]|uniref:hypothetical protein n=1 Tax=Bradyrhizobium sp. ARR65 TaxID=1040989 RepID=UPI00046386AF|nr:hypothetical protein [Bradyrhizobium sp. ARR65]